MEKDKNGFEKHVSNERTHLSQVRRAFADGIKTKNPDPRSINFLISCCDYLSFSLKRLIEQDHVLHERLIPHVSEDNKEYKEKLNKKLGWKVSRWFMKLFEEIGASLLISKSIFWSIHATLIVCSNFLYPR